MKSDYHHHNLTYQSAFMLTFIRRLMEQLARLVEENEAAKKKENEFKDTCRKESEKIKKEIRYIRLADYLLTFTEEYVHEKHVLYINL